ncbi:GNAT family N-acetyltransferase [Undibacterium oligocarboniphilum]|uniref:GNAT family N-acetyltransferase n=1 Tax=Undibacterium oligocarboniphilum TaxID=666702 RepID=A0A850QNX5_9BURK|nr:GNAT family N-acetyltransferase [Undibacterium oligocarboniphilum]MBC3870103.1 GNAT family N-acetyltransferase [Undibacterium oligocarboniphilum]NVO78094.1 GNAT family N-acetyltransferase [Undibacterium oligocarboniphilum]
MMKFSQISVDEIDVVLERVWLHQRNLSPVFQSPYYHPAYTRIMAVAQPDVRVLVIEDHNQIIGFFPFQRKNALVAGPVGGSLTDYQGPVCSPGMTLPVLEMLRAAQVHYMGFNHMPAERREFAAFSWEQSRSLTLNLAGGFDAYMQTLTQLRDASLFKKTETNQRKLTKKAGPLRFVMESRSRDDFLALLKGKSAQFIKTVGAKHDIFAVPWIRDAVNNIFEQTSPEFSGMLSTLYAGDHLVAAHFGMRSGQVLHYWFPWYDTDYAEFSPGLILLAACAREAQQHGITLIDLGRGEQAYKQRFATDFIPLCEGAIAAPHLIRDVQMCYRSLRQNLKQSAAGKLIRQWKQH